MVFLLFSIGRQNPKRTGLRPFRSVINRLTSNMGEGPLHINGNKSRNFPCVETDFVMFSTKNTA